MNTLFVFATSGLKKPAAQDFLENIYGYEGLKLEVFKKNKTPLLELLISLKDKYKDTYYGDRPPKNVVFMHDDIHVLDLYFDDWLKLGFQKYDYFGVAGTNMMLTENPKWHLTPNCNKKKNHGLMEHQSPDGRRFMTAFGPYPAACPIFDGVFMAFKWELFKKFENVPELDGFHMYDMELCTQAWDLGYKGGVVGIHLFHESRGEGILSSDWNKYAKVYVKKWKDKHKIIGG
jgi:GT2 family glycosyltransferase